MTATSAMPQPGPGRPRWSAGEFLASLAQRGIVLLTAGGVVLAYPAERLTDADRKAIRRHRTALMQVLPEAVPVA